MHIFLVLKFNIMYDTYREMMLKIKNNKNTPTNFFYYLKTTQPTDISDVTHMKSTAYKIMTKLKSKSVFIIYARNIFKIYLSPVVRTKMHNGTLHN